jgi:hypothetical protein
MTCNLEEVRARLDVLCGGIPDSLVPRTVILIPNQRSTGTAWSVQLCEGIVPCVWVYLARV